MSMEFKMTTDLGAALPAEIVFNYEELETTLTERLQHYNGLVVTEDTIKECKADRANLNKLKEAIETRRKEIKKQCMEPYTAFEAKVKKLVALIEQPIATIDGQLKAFDEAKKAEKQQAIQEYYSANVATYLQTVIPLERIQKKDWLNATKDIKKVQLEIVEAVAKVTADLECLNGMPTDDYTTAVRAKYMETLDITVALAHRKSLQSAAEAFNATKATMPAQAPIQATEPERAPERVPSAPPVQNEKLYTLRLEMHLTMAQANDLKKFLASAGIKYEKI